MDKLKTYPRDDGFYMPAEFSRHYGTVMIWPERPGSWGIDPHNARCAFAKIINILAEHEKVFVAAGERGIKSALQMLSDKVTIIQIETNDSWARDIAPTFLINNQGNIRGVDWRFNAWGGEYDGLYKNYVKDNNFAYRICNQLDIPCYDAQHFVLEGGAVHSDGEGTIIVTEACLLSKGRNPHMSKADIELNLKKYLGAEKLIWLPYGIYNDETNEHVDNVCAFTEPACVLLAWTDNKNDPQYTMSEADIEVLSREKDAKGRGFTITKLPIPDNPVCFTEADCNGFEFEDGEDTRTPGERLAASYVNFYFANDVILVPSFGGDNQKSDIRAKKIIESVCPGRKVIMINAQSIIKGGGNIHCITQQIPENIDLKQM